MPSARKFMTTVLTQDINHQTRESGIMRGLVLQRRWCWDSYKDVCVKMGLYPKEDNVRLTDISPNMFPMYVVEKCHYINNKPIWAWFTHLPFATAAVAAAHIDKIAAEYKAVDRTRFRVGLYTQDDWHKALIDEIVEHGVDCVKRALFELGQEALKQQLLRNQEGDNT